MVFTLYCKCLIKKYLKTLQTLQIATTRDSCGSVEHRHALCFPARDDRFTSSKGLGRARIVFPLGVHVIPLNKFFKECCPGAAIPILGMAEMKVSEISLVAVVYCSLCGTHCIYIYICIAGHTKTSPRSEFFPYKSYYYIIIVSKNRFLADKILLQPSLFVPIGYYYDRWYLCIRLYRRISR